MNPTGSWGHDLFTAFTNQHAQLDGSHTAVTATSVSAGSIVSTGDLQLRSTSLETIASERFFDHVASGCVITGTGYGTTLNWSMTSGVVYIGGKRLTVAAATGTVTASKDTYFDLLDPGSGTVATLVNTGGNIVANNAASPALAASSVRIGIVVSGATIAAATSIAQGGFANTAPVISSQVLKGFDSLGNLVYPKGPSSPVRTINPYKFRVYRAAAQNTVNGTTKILFDTKTYDTGANFDVTTNNRFVAPVAGFYTFSATAQTTSTANFQLSLAKNGTSVSSGVNSGGSGVNQGSIVTDTLQLAAGDYVEVFVTAGSVVAMFVGSGGVYFSGSLVSTS